MCITDCKYTFCDGIINCVPTILYCMLDVGMGYVSLDPYTLF